MDADDLWVIAPEGFTKTQVPSVTPSLDENENDLLGPQFLLPSLSHNYQIRDHVMIGHWHFTMKKHGLSCIFISHGQRSHC